MVTEASGVALWRRSGSGMEVGGFCLDRGGVNRSGSFLLRSWVGAAMGFRRRVICRRGSICRLLQVSRVRMDVCWWLGSRFHGSDEPSGVPILLGVRSRTLATFWCGWLCGVSVLWRWVALRRRGSARWRDGGACRHWQRPWWIVVMPWWIAALESCGEWWLGRAVGLGPRYLGLLLSLVLFSFCFSVFCSVNKSLLVRVGVMDSDEWFELDGWFRVSRVQSFAGFWPRILLSACAEVSGRFWDGPPYSYLLWLDPITVNANSFGLCNSISHPIQSSSLDSLTVQFSVFRVCCAVLVRCCFTQL